MRRLGVILAMLLAWPALASDGVPSNGALSDQDFYRLAACGAPPGGKCQQDFVRWKKRQVTVALAPDTDGVPAETARQVDKAVDQAIATLNRAGAGVQLRRDDGLRRPDILIRRTALTEGEKTRSIPRFPDGEEIGVGFMWLYWRGDNSISQAGILISSDIYPAHVRSVVLEEIMQCLGFLFDIENPAYEGRSILAQDSNSTITIIGQDRAILLLHYPPN